MIGDHARCVLSGACLILLSSVALSGKEKMLRPIPEKDQQVGVFVAKVPDSLYVTELKGGIRASAFVKREKQNFSAFVMIHDSRPKAIEVEQEKVFLLNANNVALYRLSEDELKLAWARYANAPPPPPPPPRHYYTIQGTTSGNYTLTDLGSGYYSMSGFSTGSYQVQEHEDYSSALFFLIGAKIAEAHRHHKANQALDEIERLYLKNGPLEPDKWANGYLVFSRPETVAPKLPVTLVAFVEDEEFRFVFDEK